MQYRQYEIGDDELGLLADVGGITLARRVQALLRQQLSDSGCPDIAQAYTSLRGSQVRRLPGKETIWLRHNPLRRRNMANYKADIAAGRPCFLCPGNLKPGERGIAFREHIIFYNPFPIVAGGIVIVDRRHILQDFLSQIPTAMALAKELRDSHYILYNGPEVGASAPDHRHLQGYPKDILYLRQDLARLKRPDDSMSIANAVDVFVPKGLGRTVVVLESGHEALLQKTLHELCNAFRVNGQGGALDLNVIVEYNIDHWCCYIFPRAKYRPQQFHDGGLMISPAAVELGGLVVAARAEDYAACNYERVGEILHEVCMPVETILEATQRVLRKERAE